MNTLIKNKIFDVEPDRQTNWYVITGGPSSGKTTTVNLLNKRGYKTTIEHARHYLDTQLVKGKTVDEIRSNQKEFQSGILHCRIPVRGDLRYENPSRRHPG